MANDTQNPKVHVDIRTNSLAFFDSKSNMLKISFYGESMGIVYIPPLNVNGKNTWPKENQISVLLTKDRVAGLYQIIMDKFLQKHRDGVAYNCGVFVNRDKTNVVDVANVPGTGVTFSIFQNIDADRIPGKAVSFDFEPTPFPEGYNPKTGEFTVGEVHAIFCLFVKTLEAFVMSINGAFSHAERNYNRFGMSKSLSYLSQMAAKMGIVEPQYGSGPSWGNSSGGFDNYNNGGDNNIMNTIEESTNLEDLM